MGGNAIENTAIKDLEAAMGYTQRASMETGIKLSPDYLAIGDPLG